jgi:tetratricopeptide (TPR) repeat protein
MPIDWSVWGPPLATVAAGGVVATLLLQRSANGDNDARVEREGRTNDLVSTHDEVLEALKHLETEREKLPPAEYAAERARLLARGSRALEALDGASGTPVAPVASGAPEPAMAATAAPAATVAPAAPAIGGEWRGALFALAGVALAWMLWNFIQGESAPRGSGSMTGNLPGEQVGGAPVQDPTQSAEFKARVAGFEQALSANPKDMAALNGLTQLYLSHGVPEQAFEWSKKAMEADPKDLDARTYRAVLTAMMGMLDPGLAALDVVLAEAPDHQKALVYKGLILLELGKHAEAVPVLEKAAAAEPGNPMLQAKLAEAKAGPGAMPPMGGPPPGGAGELLVAGTLQLDPAAQAAVKGTETLFLSLADPTKPGPPVAADRIAGPFSFPIPFDLTTADIRAMPGAGGVPAVMDLKVRFDGDGNAMTKEPGLPLAIVTGVSKGTGGLVVTLSLDGAPTAAPAGAAPAPAGNPMLAPMGAPSGGETLAAGRVTLGAGVSAVGNETVFVSVKDPAGGPPLAVKKLAPVFPLDFTVTRADIIQMAGPRSVPANVTVTVRLDRDGSATTKDGPSAELAGVGTGTAGLSLTLQ